MNGKPEDEKTKESWIELFCFMTTSARGCVEEPTIYGPFRLIDSMEKIISILEKQGAADEFLKNEKEKIQKKKLIVVTDREAFVQFLDELVMDFTKKLKKTKL